MGDPIVTKEDDRCFVAGIHVITLAGKPVKCYHVDQQDCPTLLLEVQELVTKEVAGKLYWTGTYKGTVKKVLGAYVTPIKPELDLNPPDGTTIFVFDMSYLMDIGLSLRDVPSDDVADGLNITCKLCEHRVKIEDMRQHVGDHIRNDQLLERCGFCGTTACSSTLKRTSKRGDKIFYKLESNCPYFVKWGRIPNAFTARNKCTNHVIKCPKCQADVWPYNLPNHYQNMHADTELSADLKIGDIEHKYISS